MEENKYLVSQNTYLKKLITNLEEERRVYSINENLHSYQKDYVDSKVLMEEIKYLKKKCAKLKLERNYYMNSGGGGCGVEYDLFKKYMGLYNKEENTLILHHFVDNENIYPYGCYSFDGDYACYSVRGSWDNWNKDYKLHKRCVRDSNEMYEGYVYYIIEENIIAGNEYEFKFKDVDGEWIEPVYEEESADEVDCLVKLKENSKGIWNAAVTVRSTGEVLSIIEA